MDIHKVAVLGLGNISLRHRKNLRTLYPSAEILGVSASGRIPTTNVRDCDRVLADVGILIDERPDFCIVASPATKHVDHACGLVEAGIPVLIEKPLAAGVDDIDRLISVVKRTGTLVRVGYCLRHLPSANVVKGALDQGLLGLLFYASVHVGQYLPDWRPNTDYHDSVSANRLLGGGALLELSHELDYALWLLGDLTVQQAVLRSSKILNLDVEDSADLLLTGEGGLTCSVHLDFLQRNVQRFSSFVGAKGRLDWDLKSNSVTLYKDSAEDVIYSEPDWDRNKMYLKMLQDFVSMIVPRDCVSCSGASIFEAKSVVKLVEHAKQGATLRSLV